MHTESPIFIVGVPRSGTTLLAALLAAHSQLSCGPETHFFSKTGAQQRQGAVDDPNWPHEAVRLLTSLATFSGSVCEKYSLSSADLTSYLKRQTPSQAAMLESLTVQYAQRQDGGPQWIEKTPGHLRNVREIRDVYPTARIVHIVRDPRDAVLSLTSVPWASPSPVVNAFRWAEMEKAGYPALAGYEGAYTLRYEDLLADPTREVHQLCRFLGVAFEEEMLDPSRSAEHVVSDKQPWKDGVRKPIDPSNAFKWKQAMPQPYAQAVSLLCHEGIHRYAYPDPVRPRQTVYVYGLNREMMEAIEQAVLDYASEQIHITPGTADLLSMLASTKKYIGIVEVPLLKQPRIRRALTVVRLCVHIIKRASRGRPVVYWRELMRPPGTLLRILHAVLRLAGTRMDPRTVPEESCTQQPELQP